MEAATEAWNVVVVTDGAGSFQARCQHCEWRSVWYEPGKQSPESYSNALAIRAAKEHGEFHAKQAERAQ